MKCPKCHADNPDTSRFCGNCATSLTSFKAVPPSITETLESPVRTVTPGTVFAGRYEVLERIGAGGMGEVYRAIDKNLGRHVAIKVLPPAFAEDQERMARFEREAKLLAVLNHPNIAAIHGLEEFEGRRFLVLELAEGETLQARLNRGTFLVEETLEICHMIAEGLEAAHEKGIIHRDLKPGNIMITPEGKVKILDFGLAKAFAGETTAVNIEKSPTITAEMTGPGVILGTAAYMSPEQARGRSVDKRTDIWAFGCILYECLTGSRAFSGETVSDTLAHILKGEPDWSRLPAEAPTLIRILLRRCLEKDPRNRLHDISDARIEIADARSHPLSEEAVPVKAPDRFRWIFAVGLVAIMVAASIGIFIGRKTRMIPVGSIVRTNIELFPGTQLTRMGVAPGRTEISFAPDGQYFVFSASPDGVSAKAMLYRRSLDSAVSTPIPGTEGAMSPFISPDGRWIGFWARGKIFKIASGGGIPVDLFDCKTMPPLGMCWGPKENFIVSQSVNTGLSELSEKGDIRELTKVDPKKEYSHRLPHILPGGNALLMTVMPFSWGVSAWIEVLNLKSGERKILIEDGADARYVPTGHIVFTRRGTLMAAPFDLDRLMLTGPPVPVIENLLQALNSTNNQSNSGSGQYCFSTTGVLLYASGGILPNPEFQFRWVDRRGSVKPFAKFGTRQAYGARISPDGKKLVYASTGTEENIWLYDIERGTSAQVTSKGEALFPNWTPDGKRLTFSWSNAGPLGIWWKALDTEADFEPLATSEFNLFPGSWTRDGRFLSVVESNPRTHWNILIFDMKEKKLQSFLATDADEQWPDFSPDGRWLAYSSDKTGRNEVYVRSFPGGDKEFVISNNGGHSPLWSPDGKELFYSDLEGKCLMKTDITTKADFSAGPPLVMFEYYLGGGNPIRGYDITPDGQEFLCSVRSELGFKPVEVTRLNLVLNWFEELKRLVPPR